MESRRPSNLKLQIRERRASGNLLQQLRRLILLSPGNPQSSFLLFFFFFIFWEGGVMAPLLRLLQEAAQGNVCFCRAVKVDRALVEERRAGFPTHWGEKPFYRKTMFHGQIKKIRISCFISVIPPATPFLFRLYSKSISLPIYLSIYVSIYIYFASS